MTNVDIRDMQECIDLKAKRDRAVQAQADKAVDLIKSAMDTGYDSGDYRTASRLLMDASMEIKSLWRLMDNMRFRARQLGVSK